MLVLQLNNGTTWSLQIKVNFIRSFLINDTPNGKTRVVNGILWLRKLVEKLFGMITYCAMRCSCMSKAIERNNAITFFIDILYVCKSYFCFVWKTNDGFISNIFTIRLFPLTKLLQSISVNIDTKYFKRFKLNLHSITF